MSLFVLCSRWNCKLTKRCEAIPVLKQIRLGEYCRPTIVICDKICMNDQENMYSNKKICINRENINQSLSYYRERSVTCPIFFYLSLYFITFFIYLFLFYLISFYYYYFFFLGGAYFVKLKTRTKSVNTDKTLRVAVLILYR